MVKIADVPGLIFCGPFVGVVGRHIPKEGESKENLEKCRVLSKGVIFEFKFYILKSKFRHISSLMYKHSKI